MSSCNIPWVRRGKEFSSRGKFGKKLGESKVQGGKAVCFLAENQKGEMNGQEKKGEMISRSTFLRVMIALWKRQLNESERNFVGK